ncbi:MAG: DinB family protein [Saprospiraceae bacterium]|nr:DinB family protein [Saprospiraceae bacterium]
MNRRIEHQLNVLDAALEKLEQSLKGYTAEQLNRKPAPNEWSAMQVVNHVLLSESGSLGYLRKKLSNPGAIKKAGFGSAFRTWLLNLTQKVTLVKFKAPSYINEDHLPPVSEPEAVFKQWHALRREIRTFMEAQPDEVFAKEAFRHPRAGRITLLQMLLFFEAHFNRHVRQIKRALR